MGRKNGENGKEMAMKSAIECTKWKSIDVQDPTGESNKTSRFAIRCSNGGGGTSPTRSNSNALIVALRHFLSLQKSREEVGDYDS